MYFLLPVLRVSIVCMIAAVVAACLQLDPVASERMASGVSDPATITSSDTIDSISPAEIYAASGHSARRPVDLEQDERRNALEVLNFFGILPGMVVLDLYSGGGYYAELLSIVVGPDGLVVAHNNTSYLEFASDELAARYSEGRLNNAERLIAENNQLELAANRFDAVIMIKSYHDVYLVSDEMGWSAVDRPKLLQEIFSALKPGGVLGIVDHAADPGGQPESGSALHRIDPAVIRRDMAAAGFRFEAESNVLHNPDDDHSLTVFDPSVSGRTDRAVLRFRKP
jgi:predicted methyltransferase